MVSIAMTNKTNERPCYVDGSDLHDYKTGTMLRRATEKEARESELAAKSDVGLVIRRASY